MTANKPPEWPLFEQIVQAMEQQGLECRFNPNNFSVIEAAIFGNSNSAETFLKKRNCQVQNGIPDLRMQLLGNLLTKEAGV